MRRFVIWCLATVLVFSASLTEAEDDNCRAQCSQVRDECNQALLPDCDNGYNECLKACAPETVPAGDASQGEGFEKREPVIEPTPPPEPVTEPTPPPEPANVE